MADVGLDRTLVQHLEKEVKDLLPQRTHHGHMLRLAYHPCLSYLTTG